jgi:hypothetical protein
MNAAREKLLEAQYFLQRMRENSSDRDAFKYNLSAFLSAARSVTFYMQKEFKHTPGFEEWYAAEQEVMRRDPLMTFFVEARNVSLKQQHVPTRAHVGVEITERVTVRPSWEGVVIRADGTRERVETNDPGPPSAPERTDTEPTVEWRWYFEDLPPVVDEKNVVTLSEEHVGGLEAIVSECESRFAT